VTAANLKKIGINVDLQIMDWGSVISRRSKKESPEQGGWNIFHTTAAGPSTRADRIRIGREADGALLPRARRFLFEMP